MKKKEELPEEEKAERSPAEKKSRSKKAAEGEAVVGVRGRVMSLAASGCIRGRFRSNARGFGFVTPEEGSGDGTDIYIPADETAYAVDGDTVVVRMHANRDRRECRTEGEVIRIVSHSLTSVTGTVIPVPPEYPVTNSM